MLIKNPTATKHCDCHYCNGGVCDGDLCGCPCCIGRCDCCSSEEGLVEAEKRHAAAVRARPARDCRGHDIVSNDHDDDDYESEREGDYEDDIPVLLEETSRTFGNAFQYGSPEWKAAVKVVIAAIVVTAGLCVYERVSPRPPVAVECK